MEEKSTSRANLDLFFWGIIIILTVAGIFANYYFREVVWSLRFALGIVLVCILLGLTALTAQGKRLWNFTKEARMELRKVAWPTRDETVKTTAVIAVLVFVMSIILWGLDSVLFWGMAWITK